jgi:DNA topoisomerase III
VPPRQATAKRLRAKRGATGASSPRSKAPRGEQRSTPGRKTGSGTARAKRTVKAAGNSPLSDVADGETPLRIPFGNKEAALQLGARYRAGGWYAPPGVDLGGFRERGWL